MIAQQQVQANMDDGEDIEEDVEVQAVGGEHQGEDEEEQRDVKGSEDQVGFLLRQFLDEREHPVLPGFDRIHFVDKEEGDNSD